MMTAHVQNVMKAERRLRPLLILKRVQPSPLVQNVMKAERRLRHIPTGAIELVAEDGTKRHESRKAFET